MSIQIGELSARTDCDVATIRYYEKEGLLAAPERSAGNYRLYNDEHVEALRFIRHCRSFDLGLNEIRTLLGLRASPSTGCRQVNQLLDDHLHEIEARIAALEHLKEHLLVLRAKCNGDRPGADCGLLKGLADCSCCHFSPGG